MITKSCVTICSVVWIIGTHSHKTRFKNNFKINIPKLITTFAQLGPHYYIFIYVLLKFKVNFQDFYNPISFKQLIIDTVVNELQIKCIKLIVG